MLTSLEQGPTEAEPWSSAPGETPKKPSHRPPAATPTQEGPLDIRFDYNGGCRLRVPKGSWRVRLSDIDTGNILFETKIGAGRINSSKHYYLRIRIEVWSEETLVFTHDYAATGKNVLVQFPVGTLGDSVGWFPYAVKFQRAHGCQLTCSMAGWLIPVFKDAYPEIESSPSIKKSPNATTPRIIWGCSSPMRHGSFNRAIFAWWVCIATQSTTQCKYWNNPHGWRELIRFAKSAGFRVICIDQKPAHGTGRSALESHSPRSGG